jgi:putative ABC transport system permease protein
MKIIATLRIALKALRQNALRSGLTMLGIVIGVGAVICVVAIGEGAAANVERAISNIGANMIWVEAGGVNRGGVRTGSFGTKTLVLEDFQAIKDHIPLVTNVTPQVDTRVQVVFGNQNWGTTVRGVGPEYLALKGWNITRGGMYTEVDVERAGNVCVLGQTVADQLFGEEDPIGETIRRAGGQRTVGDRPGSGRHVPDAVHDRDEEDQRSDLARRHFDVGHISSRRGRSGT